MNKPTNERRVGNVKKERKVSKYLKKVRKKL